MATLPKRFLDTVALTQTYLNLPPVEEFLSLEWYKKKRDIGRKLCSYILKVPKNSHLPRMTLSQTPDYVWHLTVEVSFSAWLRGSNIQPFDETEIPYGLQWLSDHASQKSGLIFDAFKSNVSRIDVVDDMFVGQENMFRNIKNISRIKLNLFNRTNINDETVYFNNIGQVQNFVITFYDKYKQACKKYPNADDLELARGILRQEVRLRKEKINKIVKDLALPNRTAEVFLTQKVAEHILNYCKDTVHFDLSLSDDNDWVLETATKLPIVKAILVIGFIILLRRFGNDFYKNEIFDFNQRSYQRYIKKCFDSGINPYE